jgi:mannobiose 2-epimerase
MDLSVFLQEIRMERDSILEFWAKNSLDLVNGGFIGKLDYSGNKDYSSIKGGVLNARILWTFSSAFLATGNTVCKEIAERAFEYIKKHLIDHANGGTYWSVDAMGKKMDGRKQIYGLAFAIYGFSEYYKISKNQEALIIAKIDELDASMITMLEAKKNSGTNDSFAYNKHIGNIYLK